MNKVFSQLPQIQVVGSACKHATKNINVGVYSSVLPFSSNDYVGSNDYVMVISSISVALQ
jgi:primosomal replication protein N